MEKTKILEEIHYINMNNLICPFCLQDISNGNHEWNCPLNPININNNEFQTYIPCVNNLSNNSISNEMPHYYHISWLEIAINNFKNENVHVINKNMTIGEFIEKYTYEKC